MNAVREKRKTWQKADLYKWANDQQQLDMRAKALLKEMVGLAASDGTVWFLVADMAYACNCVDRTIQLILRKLAGEGLIELTDDRHRLKESTRSVPIYRLLPDGAPAGSMGEIMGENLSPMDGAWVKSEAGMGETGFHPQGQQGQQERADALSTGASGRDALFEGMVGATAPSMLLFADLEAARSAVDGLAEMGAPVERLAEALAFMAADPTFRSREHPPQLHTWLAKGMWRGWLGKLDAARAAAAPAAAEAAEPQGDGRIVALIAAAGVTPAQVGTYLRPATLHDRGAVAYLVAFTGVARDWIVANCWRRIEETWSDIGRGAELRLVTKLEFAALMRQQGEA